jgi:hypothetical protein
MSRDITRVDLLGRLSNPPYNFGRMIDQVPRIRTRPNRQASPPVKAVQAQTRLRDDDVIRLINDYSKGGSVQDLTKSYRVHRTTVLAILERHGVDRRPLIRKMSDPQVKQAAGLYATGLSLACVAERLGVNAATIRRELQKASIPIRARRGWPVSSDSGLSTP